MKLPLFPLNAHVFPGGKLSLRIFEARYLRMIKERAGKEPCFAMGMLEDREGGAEVLPWATQVRMVDFSQLEDGLLGIVVEGVQWLHIEDITTDDDGLRWADCKPVSIWSEPNHEQDASINSALLSLFGQYPELGKLYPEAAGQSMDWSLQRWLEVLPIDAGNKVSLLNQLNSKPAFEFVNNLLHQGDP
ncbi:LON peptidase substrate-binding domain-containing protein [Ferrimonas aestuarii]|uniref:Peptidase S16 n=1 Tax=Ferrimonas aestuarii TaxID=2569539 RepID=A0A4U1BQV7_9GAMM|nr:LON peptidase substrate-binding domain-containing protein [Ferrimonas aestuarii]TKB56555.1 peptidase S16 [Ferrimonas aestuarii]